MVTLHSRGQPRGPVASLPRSCAALGALVLGLAAACTSEQSGTTLLELWAAGREGEVVAALIPDFEASHPGIQVRVQQLPWMGAHEKLLTAVVGDSTPDVAQLGNTWIPEFATIHALAALDTEQSASDVVVKADYFPGVWDTNQVDGRLLGVPWYVDTRVLFYRRDLLNEAGFSSPPGTWGELLKMLQAIQARAAQAGQYRAAIYLPPNEPEPLLTLALQQPDPLLREGDRFGNFQSPGFRRALEFYASLFQAGLARRESSAEVANLWDEFARGSFVFYMSGPWQIGEFERRLPVALADSWTTAPLPGQAGPGASLALGASLVVFERSQKKQAAWQLLEYLSRPDVQRRFFELTGDLPPRRSSWQDPRLASNAHAKAFREQMERVKPTPKVPEWERITTEVRIIGERAARGTASVEDAARELDARADRILEKRRWLLGPAHDEPAAAPLPASPAPAGGG
jgi:multiple sugar transport system substrate-binding protein